MCRWHTDMADMLELCADDSNLGTLAWRKRCSVSKGTSEYRCGGNWATQQNQGKLGTCGLVGEAERMRRCTAHSGTAGPGRGAEDMVAVLGRDTQGAQGVLWWVSGESKVPGSSKAEETLRIPLTLFIQLWSKEGWLWVRGGLSLEQLCPHCHSKRSHHMLEAALFPGAEQGPWSDHVAPLLTTCTTQAASNLSEPQVPVL